MYPMIVRFVTFERAAKPVGKSSQAIDGTADSTPP
jgi:hypothetical protein